MSPIDLHGLAATKGSAQPASAAVSAFVHWATGAQCFSTNCSSRRLTSAIVMGHVETVHEWTVRTMTPAERKDYFEKPWMVKRLAFEAAFIGGGLFFYAAFNLGDMGTEKYGDYCVIFPFDWARGSVVLPGDSLRDYWNSTGGRPNTASVMADVYEASESAVVAGNAVEGRGAVLRHAPDVVREGDWYVEMICKGSPSVADFAEVRISKARERDILFLAAMPNALTASLAQLAEHNAVLRRLKNSGVPVRRTI